MDDKNVGAAIEEEKKSATLSPKNAKLDDFQDRDDMRILGDVSRNNLDALSDAPDDSKRPKT